MYRSWVSPRPIGGVMGQSTPRRLHLFELQLEKSCESSIHIWRIAEYYLNSPFKHSIFLLALSLSKTVNKVAFLIRHITLSVEAR
uniref:Uncharacterized protein n=1 Tax=Solanum tuberosum TaxID=4113 RepID=M1DTE2_SOLTU